MPKYLVAFPLIRLVARLQTKLVIGVVMPVPGAAQVTWPMPFGPDGASLPVGDVPGTYAVLAFTGVLLLAIGGMVRIAARRAGAAA